MSLPANFWAKTTTSDCVLWVGAVNNKGYACFAIDGKSHLAHRLAWMDAHGPIPEGLEIDHTCRVRNCVNVEHLELVTPRENSRRKPHSLRVGGECSQGHAIGSDLDIYTNPRGRNECRACRRVATRRAKERRAKSGVAA